MDRLTHERCNGIKTGYWSAAKREAVVQRLAEYEDSGLSPAEVRQLARELREGFTVRIPIRVGDEVFFLIDFDDDQPFVHAARVTDVSFRGFCTSASLDDPNNRDCLYPWTGLNKDFFFSEQDAGKALDTYIANLSCSPEQQITKEEP